MAYSRWKKERFCCNCPVGHPCARVENFSKNIQSQMTIMAICYLLGEGRSEGTIRTMLSQINDQGITEQSWAESVLRKTHHA